MTTQQVKKKVLVVDDDPGVIKLLTSILAATGLDVVTAQDGLDAMVQVKHHLPDLIVLDIMMPEINGYEVCRNLKFDNKYKQIPIIILTSRDQELDPRIGQMMGIEYLPKPLDREVLLAKIQAVLK